MADNTIDTLELEIKSSSTSAVHALDKLAATLEKLNTSFKKTNTGGVRNYVREIGRVSESIKALSGIKVNVTNLSGVGKEFKKLSEKLSDIDTTKIQVTSDGIAKISHSMSLLNDVDFKDSKITNVLGALKRLAEVDMGKFDSSGIASIVSSISNLSDIPDVSSGLNRFMSSLQKLVNAGDKTEQVANQLPDLGKVLKNIVNDMAGAKKVSESVNLFVQSIGRLASAGNKTGQTAGQLKKLSDETLNFFNSMKNAPKISENTIRMTQALAQLAAAGGRVGVATNSITNSFNKISNIGKKTLSSINKISNGIISSFQKIGSSSRHLKTASFNLGTLLKTAVGFGTIRGLWNFGKQSVKLGSDITEVQNVVDVAFGSMAGMVDEFAKTSAEKFGLSELAAKQYSGTMMAMLKSSGIMKESATEMSTTLAGLAGDIASFYNIDTDEAFRKIRSGIAGEIEPLRQLGISMTVANLESFALSQGITKSYQAMTQAEQVMLRYNYLMWASADAQGDFARTSGNYANQIRLLKLNIQQLAATLGQGLIAAIQPAIQALNKLMSVLIKAANAFKVFMYTLMGKKIEDSAGGIIQDISGIGDAGDVAADGLGDASGASDKLKKKLSVLPFDQLNQLTDNSDKSGSGGSGGSGGGIGGGDFGTGLDDILSEDKEGPTNEWAKRIREAFLAEDWEKLGFEIADGLNLGLQKVYDVISWENVGPKITEFTTAFTETFNSLVTHFDWDLLGRTVGAGVNTIVNTLNQLADGIDWVNLGSKMAEGFNGLFDEIDWKNLGHLIGNKFRIAWDMFAGFVKDLDYAEIGRSVAEFLTGAFNTTPFGEIGTALSNLIDGAFEALKNFTAKFEWGDFANNVSEGISNFLKDTEWKENGEALGSFLLNLVNALKSVLTKDTFYDFGKAVGEFLGGLPWLELLKSAAELIIGGLGSALKGLFESGLEGTITAGISGAFLAVKVADITGLSSLAKLVASHFSKKFETDQTIKKLADALGKTLSSSATTASTALDTAEAATGKAAKGGFKSLLSKIKDLGTHAGSVASGGLKSLLSALGSSGAGIGLIAILPVATSMLAGFVEKSMGGNGKLSDMGGTVNDLAGRLQNLGTISDVQADEIRKMIDSYEDSGKSAQEMVDGIITKFSEWGLSTEEANMVLQNNEFYTSKSAESMNLLTQSITQLGTGFSQTAEQINLSGVSASEAWSAIRSSLDELSVSGSQFDEQYKGVLQSLDMSGMSSENAQDALDSVVMALEAAGVPTNDFIQMMLEKFPEAFVAVKKSAETNMDGAQKAVSDNMKSAEENAKKSTKEIADSASENFMKVDDEATKAFGNVSDSSRTDWGSSYDSVNEALNKMKSVSSEKMRQIFKNVESYTNSIWNITANNWDAISQKIFNVLGNINQELSLKMNAIVSEFSNLGSRIENSVGDLYSVGQSAAQSFASGFQSIHIPTPQLYISSWSTHRLEGGKQFQTPNFSINWYKRGGLFNGASVIGVGEAGKEAVLPLENKRTMSMIADSIVKSSSGMGIDEETLANAVARGVSMAMLNGQNPVNVTCYAELRTEDNEVLARAVTKGQRSIDSRMNPTLQFGY